MGPKEQIAARLTEAMKAKDSVAVDCLRLIIATIKNREIEKRGELTDAEFLKALSTLAKQRDEAIEMYRKGNRPELAAKEEREREIIASFLPQPLSDAELAALVDETIAAVGATTMKEMGRVMQELTPRIAGRADGKAASALVKRKLGGGS